ncbi:MAG: tetratricopeptide repeat protein [bacterium]|nr:tetratricopeptide repeat protein [bacterium]
MAEQDLYEQPREWWDPLAVIGVAALVYGLLSLLSIPGLHPSVWDDVAVAAGLRPPANPFPGLYRLLLEGLFSFLPAGFVLDALPHLGRGAIALSAMFVYLVFRDALPATLRVKVHMARIGANVGRMCALYAAVLFTCADPIWRAGQCFTPVSLFLLLVTGAVYLFFRFLRKGSIPALYGCCAVLGVVSAESTLGFLLAFLVAAGVVVAVRWANDPDVPLVNPLVDDLVREIVFKRLTYIWAFFFVLAVGVNVWRFVVQGGLEAAGSDGVLGLLFEYFRGAWMATKGAATGPGWLFFALLALGPFILALKLLPKAWDDDKFLPWIVGVVYAIVGAVALSQLAGAKVLWFWTWLGATRPLVPSDTFLSFILLFDVAALAFALAVFGVDAICRNYRRIAQQQYPESMLEQVPAQMAESLGKARRLRKIIYWSLVFMMPLLVLPGRWMSTERGIAEAIRESVEETLRETEGCEAIFTDGSFDGLLELEALRQGRSLVCLSLMAANTPRERIIRERAAHDDEDRELLKTDAASALRTWVATKPERLKKSAVQIGFEMWKRAKRELPPFSGLVALPGGVAPSERMRALSACEELGNAAHALAQSGDTEGITDLELRRRFPFVLWRLSRLAQMRSRAADEAGSRSEAFREAAKADELDEVNAQVQKMKRDMNWLKKQNGGQLSPREGLVIGLARADFALAGRYAAPVLAADPDDPRANFALGMMYYQDEQYSRSEQYLAKCLKRRPDEPAVLNNLAIVQMKLGKLDEAERNVRRVLEKHPDLSEAKKTLDRVLKAKSEKTKK